MGNTWRTKTAARGRAPTRSVDKSSRPFLAASRVPTVSRAAHLATIWEPRVKRFYQKKQAKSHVMLAKKAVAAKLARAIYHMLNNQEPFDVERAFG